MSRAIPLESSHQSRCVFGPVRRRASRKPSLAVAVAATLAASWAVDAQALDLATLDHLPTIMWADPRTVGGFAIVTGLVIFSTVLAILHVRERRRWSDRDAATAAELATLRGAADRAELLIGAERQVVLVWSGLDGEARLEGDPSFIGDETGPSRILSFGSWLIPTDAADLDEMLDRLRARGEGFRVTLRTHAGRYVDAEGRALGGRALLRLRDITGDRLDRLRLEREADETRAVLRSLHTLLDTVDEPVWLRGADGRIVFANAAYCRAVEATGLEDVRKRGLELLERSDRENAARSRARNEVYRARVVAIVSGGRRVLDIADAAVPGGSGGLAKDVSELAAVRADQDRQMQAHARLLDQLPTAVAVFDGQKRLQFHNAAYRQLWALDASFLESQPTDGEILDRLRASRRLPEQADYRAWKATLLDEYRSAEPKETWWYLPDRRTLRVVTNPNPQGGITYLFDDVSDRMQLESRFNALIRVQTETLDTLAEGVALFGSDGRLKLFNRAFVEMWKLDPEALVGEPHVAQVIELCRPLASSSEPWDELRAAVSGFSDMRVRSQARMERRDGSVLDCGAEPLPDGGTLTTFADVTASVNVERALTERNEALEHAGRLRNEFVHHVSYELRSPLTTVIGFAELLGAGTAGALNERQREYADHIVRSSGALLAIINDILDLASIDTDTIELAREEVDIVETIEAAARGIGDRLAEARLTLRVDAPPAIGSFVADGRRVRQVLFNLLSNAAGFSSSGQTITVSARKRGREVILSVSDEGRGIPDEVRGRIFDRFETHTRGTRHRGVGLGLSIVQSFVALHGGHVEVMSKPGSGTTVTCTFPADGPARPQSAAA